MTVTPLSRTVVSLKNWVTTCLRVLISLPSLQTSQRQRLVLLMSFL